MQKFIVVSLAFFVLALAVYVLSAAYTFFLPLVIAIVIAYFLIALADWIKKLSWNKWTIPDWFAYLAAIGMILVAFWGIFTMVAANVTALLQSAPEYQAKLEFLINQISEAIPTKQRSDLTKFLQNIDIVSAITGVVRMLTDIAGYAGMIAVYVIFILIEHRFIDMKMEALFRTEKGLDKTRGILEKITTQIKSYIRIKTLMSLLTGFSSYFVMAAVGVDFASFWALLIFFLNYIPTIGSIIATIFPSLLTLIQFESWMPFIVVAIALIAIQFTVGNILEPRIMGKSFNLSGLVILLSLTIWGSIWGVVGMFLCVPIMVVAIIVLSNFKETKPIAIILSQDGTIK